MQKMQNSHSLLLSSSWQSLLPDNQEWHWTAFAILAMFYWFYTDCILYWYLAHYCDILSCADWLDNSRAISLDWVSACSMKPFYNPFKLILRYSWLFKDTSVDVEVILQPVILQRKSIKYQRCNNTYEFHKRMLLYEMCIYDVYH